MKKNQITLSQQILDHQYELTELGKIITNLRNQKTFYQERFNKIQRKKIYLETKLMKARKEIQRAN